MISKKVSDFLNSNENLETPFVVFDLEILRNKYQEFKSTFTTYDIYYAVKCNPSPYVIKTLNEQGSSFDVASIEEVELCLSLGVSASNLSWGSTIKKASLIKRAFAQGITLYAFDSEEELEKIAENAPGAKVYCRLMVNNANALWPLSAKFGCDETMAEDLMSKALKLGLIPYGLSFHVGSQQLYIDAWYDAIKVCADIFKKLRENNGIYLQMLNIGGGYPAYGYVTEHRHLSEYKEHIEGAVQELFGDYQPIQIITEPGRFLVADAGVMKTEVILVSRKSATEDVRWVYLDIGMFGGLAETMEESIKYKIVTDKDNNAMNNGPVALAGPTCDGMDIMYKNYKYSLPLDLKSGDYVYILSTGGYTTSYSSVCFNGFKPLKDYYIE